MKLMIRAKDVSICFLQCTRLNQNRPSTRVAIYRERVSQGQSPPRKWAPFNSEEHCLLLDENKQRARSSMEVAGSIEVLQEIKKWTGQFLNQGLSKRYHEWSYSTLLLVAQKIS